MWMLVELINLGDARVAEGPLLLLLLVCGGTLKLFNL
jgi:hypothetical protein